MPPISAAEFLALGPKNLTRKSFPWAFRRAFKKFALSSTGGLDAAVHIFSFSS
jgi:hypothetical protein